MSFDAHKTILLEKQYLYIRASKGFELEGVSTERIWTNTGYYRFLVDNVSKTLGNSYVTVHYYADDIDFVAYCSDLFMEELQNSIVVAVENIQTYLEQFAETNHEDIYNLSLGLDGALETINTNIEGVRTFIASYLSNFGKPVHVFNYWTGSQSGNLSSIPGIDSLEVGEHVCVAFLNETLNSSSFTVAKLDYYFTLVKNINDKGFVGFGSDGNFYSIGANNFICGSFLMNIVRVS